jgi:hypothetical protein
MKRAYFLILLGLSLLILTVGCNSTGEKISTDNNEVSTIPPYTESPPSPLYDLEVSFPDGAPRLNEVARLKVILFQKAQILNYVQIEVILPEGFVLVNGYLTYEADSLPYGDFEVINAQIKSIKTGNWVIETRMQWFEEGASIPEKEGKYPIYVSVTEESAEWGINPPWQGHTPAPLDTSNPTPPTITYPQTSELVSDNTDYPNSIPTITVTIPSGTNPPLTVSPDENLPSPPAISP